MELTPATPLLTFESGKPGPSILISVAVHGDEVCGCQAVNELIGEGFFSALYSGKVTVVLANPSAAAQNARYVDRNLNRSVCPEHFGEANGYEGLRARYIAELIENHDIYLDIHSTSADCPPFALPASNSQSVKLASRLPVGFVVKDLIHTTTSRCTTIDWALKHGKTAVTVECGKHTSATTRDNAGKVIRSLILSETPASAPVVMTSTENVLVQRGFHFLRKVRCFEYVHNGKLIAQDDTRCIQCPYTEGAYVIMPTAIPIVGEEAWFWGRRV